MKKDKIASAALIILVACSVVLTVKIWISEELWSDGRNFFVSGENMFSRIFSDDAETEHDAVAPLHEIAFMPFSVAVTEVGSGASIYSGGDSEAFEQLSVVSKKILSSLFKHGGEGSLVSEGEYFDTLKSRSLLVKYSVSMPVRVVGHMCEVGACPAFEDVSSLKDFSVIPDSSADDSLLVYLHDSENGKVFKYKVPHCRSFFDEAVADFGGKEKRFVSAYELGFYKSDIGVEQSVVFDPLVFIDTSSEKPKTAVITGKTPFEKAEPTDLGAERINKFLEAFGYKPNSVRRYTDRDGTLVFVENYGTIKLFKNGVLEYTSTTPEKGINVQINSEVADNPQNILDGVDSVYEILYGVWGALSEAPLPDVRLSGFSAESYSDYSVNLDFRSGGVPIIINSGDIKHAVEMKVKNNRLVSLKAYVRSYAETGSFAENPTPIDALDSLFSEFSADSEATDLFLGYVDYGTSGKMSTHWNISSKNGETLSSGW